MSDQSSDFELLAVAANYIKNDIVKPKEQWDNSPFVWILNLPASTKGKLGTLLISQWCSLKGLSIAKSPDSDADLKINGRRIEVKFSTLWDNGTYRFQQIRDQNYEYLVCLGISPQEAHCWVITKKILLSKVIGHMGQHTGKTGTETSWLKVDPKSPPEWINDLGGSLPQAFAILQKI